MIIKRDFVKSIGASSNKTLFAVYHLFFYHLLVNSAIAGFLLCLLWNILVYILFRLTNGWLTFFVFFERILLNPGQEYEVQKALLEEEGHRNTGRILEEIWDQDQKRASKGSPRNTYRCSPQQNVSV